MGPGGTTWVWKAVGGLRAAAKGRGRAVSPTAGPFPTSRCRYGRNTRSRLEWLANLRGVPRAHDDLAGVWPVLGNSPAEPAASIPGAGYQVTSDAAHGMALRGGAVSSPGPGCWRRGSSFCPLLPVLLVGGTGVTLKAPDPTGCPRAGGRREEARRSFTGPSQGGLHQSIVRRLGSASLPRRAQAPP